MKWLLITCFLTIFSIGVIRAESDESDKNNCHEQFNNQHNLEQICINQVYNHTEFIDELQKTLVQYSGDNDAVRALADKFCPKLYQFLDCTLIGNAVDDECLFPNASLINHQHYDIAKTMLDYVCANNATALLLRIVESNGVHTIYQNTKFGECLKILSGKNIDQKSLGPTAELCDAVDRAFQCYTDYVRNHINQNLSAIADEIKVMFLQAIKCSSMNDE